MTDDEIRSLVRVAIQKHLGPGASAPQRSGGSLDLPAAPPQPPLLSISFSRYALPRAADDTMCIVEPAVTCNHCGYCQCHGH